MLILVLLSVVVGLLLPTRERFEARVFGAPTATPVAPASRFAP
jgi:hypothetical protein